MLCDLIGSTALAAELDPEELHQILGNYQKTVGAAVARFEGHLARLMGDSVMAYFGWPRALEDAAERAVHAGLAITTEMEGLGRSHGVTIAVRVGIATGIVMVGDLEGPGGRRAPSLGRRPSFPRIYRSWRRPVKS